MKKLDAFDIAWINSAILFIDNALLDGYITDNEAKVLKKNIKRNVLGTRVEHRHVQVSSNLKNLDPIQYHWTLILDEELFLSGDAPDYKITEKISLSESNY